jgi:hypothetical protein
MRETILANHWKRTRLREDLAIRRNRFSNSFLLYAFDAVSDSMDNAIADLQILCLALVDFRAEGEGDVRQLR